MDCINRGIKYIVLQMAVRRKMLRILVAVFFIVFGISSILWYFLMADRSNFELCYLAALSFIFAGVSLKLPDWMMMKWAMYANFFMLMALVALYVIFHLRKLVGFAVLAFAVVLFAVFCSLFVKDCRMIRIHEPESNGHAIIMEDAPPEEVA